MKAVEQNLFPEKEMFVKERPLKLPKVKEDEFLLKMAKEIIESNWTKYSPEPEEVAKDLEEIMSYDSGFEAAKRLEDYGDCSYNFQTDFIEFLEQLDYERRNALDELVKEWVKIHEIKPMFQKGIKLIVNIDIGHIYKLGQIIYITGIKEETACYLLWDDINHNGGYAVAFERVENSCAITE